MKQRTLDVLMTSFRLLAPVGYTHIGAIDLILTMKWWTFYSIHLELITDLVQNETISIGLFILYQEFHLMNCSWNCRFYCSLNTIHKKSGNQSHFCKNIWRDIAVYVIGRWHKSKTDAYFNIYSACLTIMFCYSLNNIILNCQ